MKKSISNIHNYIRNFTKISNEDKPFFISGCLIFLKTENNRLFLKNFNEKEYIYDLIERSLKNYSIDYTIFNFLCNDVNIKHLWNLLNKINDIYTKNPSSDLLNLFYMEFVKYNNTDGKSLGIILTPEHIVELMVKLLDINENDTILDLCTGTGSFLLQSSKYTEKLVGCEYQNKLFQLLKCNFILRDLDISKITYGNCFNQIFTATKSIINPPYGMKGNETELNFILKQLESIEEHGIAISIIPIGCVSNNLSKNKK